MDTSSLKSYLHEQIPVTELLGIEVGHCDKDKVELRAPLSINYNHKKTAFGGSLSVLGITCGWSLVYMKLLGQKNEVVIQDSQMSYLKPVHDNFSAISLGQNELDWKKFFRAFDKIGKARITIETQIFSDSVLVAKHIGTYVAFKED